MSQSDYRQEIAQFVASLRSKYGSIPRFAQNLYSKDAKKVYYAGPYFGDEELAAAIQALFFGRWASDGELSAQFERAFSAATNTVSSFFCNSGSSANLLLVAAAKEFYNWPDNSEILVSAVGFPTTTSAIVHNRLVPKFVDIEMGSLNWNMDRVEEIVSSNVVKAVFLSPVLGNPPDMDRLVRVCKDHGVILLLDNCDSLGTSWAGHHLTEYAVGSTCSLYVAHEITTLEGGMVSSHEPRLIELARSYGTWGRACECRSTGNLIPNGCCGKRFSCWLETSPDLVIDHRYVFDRMGWNLKGIDILAAIGLEQLKRLSFICQRRKENQRAIQSLFAPWGRAPTILPKADWVPFGTPMICESGAIKRALVAHLEANGIQTRNAFAGNLLLHNGYRHLGNWQDYPEANKVLDLVFFVGAAPTISQANIDHIEATLKTFNPPTL